MLNPSNLKAWYRSASACLALDKVAEAEDACSRGLEVDSKNAALTGLKKKIETRKFQVERTEKIRREREARLAAEEQALKTALQARNYRTRSTDQPPEMEDAVVKLADPLDSKSVLSVPVLLLYPLHMQTDLIKQFDETHSLGDHLSYILPAPWDEAVEYKVDSVDCYIETIVGGLIKAGKKLPLSKLLSSGKIEILDGLVRVHVVPTTKALTWIAQFKEKRPKR
jgi:Cns1/TTC4 Wheel domain